MRPVLAPGHRLFARPFIETWNIWHCAHCNHAGFASMGPFMGPACGEASNQEDVPMRTNSPRTRRTKKSPNSASRSSSGRRGPKSVNFKSPPRAVFKSSAAARQACAPDAGIAPAVRYRRPSPRVAGCRHMHASERQGSGGARGGLECLPEIRADRCGRMRRYAARVRPRPLPCSDPDP